jgi:hypothetical protein
VPATAYQHFQEDIKRARAIVAHADPLPSGNADQTMLRSDLLRSAWMFAVGALDAYFCDAYTDLVAASIISKSRHDPMVLPNFVYDIKFPVGAILQSYTANLNWKWRMAARKMMERETVLKLETVRNLFNKFFRKQYRLFGDVLDAWMTHPEAKVRLFGITPSAYNALPTADRHAAREEAMEQLEERFREIFQRRHDCIHNCDRPKVSPQLLVKAGTVTKVIQDVEFLVARCNEHINTEFRQFLLGCNCPPAIIAQAGY